MEKVFKRLLLSLIVVLVAVLTVGCSNNKNDDENYLINALAGCSVSFAEGETEQGVKSNITFNTDSSYDKATYTWSTSNANVVSTTGVVTRLAADTQVTIYVNVSYNGDTLQGSFSVKVLAMENQTPEPEPEPDPVLMTLKQIRDYDQAATFSGKVKVESATVVAIYQFGFVIKDATDTVLVYLGYNKNDVKIGDKISISSAELQLYNTSWQIVKATYSNLGADEAFVAGEATELGYSDVETYAAKTNPEIGTYVSVSGTLSVASGYYNMIFEEGTTYVVAISNPLDTFGLTIKGGLKMTVKGYLIGRSSDNKRANIVMTEIAWEEEKEEVEATSLPISASFVYASATKDQTVTPEGWTNAAALTYASGWSSFRANGQYIISPVFEAQTSVDVIFKVYLNNTGGTGNKSSKIKFIALDANGTEVTSVTSDELNGLSTGKNNATELKATLAGENIAMVKILMVKDGGGNVAFSEVTISTTAQAE